MKQVTLLVTLSFALGVLLISINSTYGQAGGKAFVVISNGAGTSQNCVAAKNCFDPSVLDIKQGTLVDWKNSDSVPHTVTSGNGANDAAKGSIFDSQRILPGNEFSFTFNNPGTFNYFCTIHPWLTGQVIVAAGTTNTTTPEFGSIAPIVLAIAVIGIVAFTAKTKGIPRL